MFALNDPLILSPSFVVFSSQCVICPVSLNSPLTLFYLASLPQVATGTPISTTISSVPSSTSTPGPYTPSKRSNTAAIVGSTLGAVAILALLMAWYLRRRRLDQDHLTSSGHKMDASGVLEAGFPSSSIAGFS